MVMFSGRSQGCVVDYIPIIDEFMKEAVM